MSEAKHTQGDWEIDSGPRSYSIGVPGKVICDMRRPEDNGCPMQEVDANAHLLVNAKRLLEACEEMTQFCRNKYGKLDFPDVWVEIKKAEAAISAAKGAK